MDGMSKNVKIRFVLLRPAPSEEPPVIVEFAFPESEILAKFDLATGKQATIDLHQNYFSPAISSLLRIAYPAEEAALYEAFSDQMAIIDRTST
jgi:hypothetical protein